MCIRDRGSEGGAFTVFWKYDNDKTITKTGYYEWREGTIEFDKNYYELNDTATVTLHDIDLEVYPYDMNTIRLRVWSDTDAEGITLTSSYMNSVWTGVQASFEFTTDERSRNDSQLRISPGDKIYAQYTDRTLPRPYSTDDDKEIFGTAFIKADLGKPIDFEKVDVTKSISITDDHKKSVSISTTIDAKNDYETNLDVYMVYQITDEDGRVVQVEIQGNDIKGILSDGSVFTTYAPNDPNLVERLTEKGVNISASPQEDKMPSILGILLSWFPMLLLIGVWIFFMRQMQGGGGKALGFGKSKAKLLNEAVGKVTFEDVAGIDEAKQELEEVVEFLKDPQKFSKLGGKIPRGALLVGCLLYTSPSPRDRG